MKNKILIVDDDKRNVFALRALLSSKGYGCLSAESAREAINVLRDNDSVAIVLLDMMMPEMDGYEAIPVIRRLAENSHIPIIAITAQAMVGDKEKCLAAGADGYISKPVDVDLLVQYLQKHVKK